MLPQTQAYRSSQATLRALLERQLGSLWPLLDPESVDASFPAWSRQAALAVMAQRKVSAVIAARYLRDLGVHVNLARPVPVEVLLRSLEITGPVAIKQGMTAGKPLATATAAAFVLSSQAAVRHMMDGGRETVRSSSLADRQVKGWVRVAAGNACDYCAGLAGTTYSTDAVGFECHDGCNCSVEPVLN